MEGEFFGYLRGAWSAPTEREKRCPYRCGNCRSEIPILVTSDGPLLKVDTKELNIALADGGLHGVQIMSARLLGAPRPQPTKR